MATKKDRDRNRARLLEALYEAVDGDRFGMVNFRELARRLDWDDEQEAGKAAQWLVDEGYADWAALGGELSITHLGITAYEVAEEMEDDKQPVNGDDVIAAEADLLAVELTADEAAQVEAVIGEVRRALERGELPIEGDDARELEVHLNTASLQLRSPRRRKAAVVAALKAAAFVGVSAASGLVGNAAWAGMISLLGALAG